MIDTPSAPASPPSGPRVERWLRARVGPDETFLAWSRGWVSRDGRAHTLFAARNLDFVVLTDRHLYLYSTGFFTRRPRKRVFAAPLDRLTTTERKASRSRHLRLDVHERHPLLLDLRTGRRSDDLAVGLLARTRPRPADTPATPEAPVTPEAGAEVPEA